MKNDKREWVKRFNTSKKNVETLISLGFKVEMCGSYVYPAGEVFFINANLHQKTFYAMQRKGILE